jgi:hypothetical protein
MNSINNCDTLGYKPCAAKDCDKKGKYRLRILFLKKSGYFCDSCASQLLELDIVTKEEDDKVI